MYQSAAFPALSRLLASPAGALLPAVTAAPDENLTILGNGDVVVRAACNGSNVLAFEAVNDARSENAGIVGTSILGDTSLAVVVDAPRPDVTVFCDSEAVVVTTSDVHNLLAGTLD